MKKEIILKLLEENLPSGLTRNSSVLSDNISPFKNGFEFYMRSSHYIDDAEHIKIWVERISQNIDIEVDFRLCDRDYDFYLLIGDSYYEAPIKELIKEERELKNNDIEYPDFWKEDVQIEGNHEFLRNEVSPLLEQLGYKRRNHYSWSFHFDRIYINSASKTTLNFEKGTFVSDMSCPGQTFFRTKIITIEDIKEILIEKINGEF